MTKHEIDKEMKKLKQERFAQRVLLVIKALTLAGGIFLITYIIERGCYQ
jgi:hypothetical protein